MRIGLSAFGKADWAAITHALAAKASCTALLLGGELPQDVEQIFAAIRLPLFPVSARDVSLDCTCPGVQVPCEHLDAVFSALTARVGADPFTLLALRGRDRETLLDELRDRLGPDETLDPGDRPRALSEVMDSFFDCGQAPGLGGAAPLRGPEAPVDAILGQVPPFAITVGGEEVAELLRPVYQALAGEAES
ncbi:hypothetical protein [Amycolatopsis sp. H20-H5]|uniref:hypothetical protein n=1 Tax=Amycolatopsis sp. H20-H5 TaxID=3046309 RepID=UPI002DBF87F4|nr:hypothetical protein [Amycolatopsis sp. H20-H5]MEC3977555.1 hypothetical protein [Amycolatopsis sp. H20-H5]